MLHIAMKLICLFTIFVFSHSTAVKFNEYNILLGHRLGGNLIPPPVKDDQVNEVLNFTQIVDHFDPNNNKTFIQHYIVREDLFDHESRNVAYIYLDGESPISGFINTGLWTETAPTTGALLFNLEHRFYGDSQPFGDLSTENLQLLSSEQALADIAYFIKSMNVKYNMTEDVKWIAFGGSYAGSLAAWVRLKYPDIVYASVSSSGPLLAKLDFKEYLEVVVEDIRATDPKCVDAIQSGVTQLQDLVENNDTINDAKEMFKLCDIEGGFSDLDFSILFHLISNHFAGLAQYGGNISLSCDILTNPNNSILENLAELMTSSLEDCQSISYAETVDVLKDVNEFYISMRQYIYQTCNEFGFYQTTNSEPHVFGNKVTLEFSIQVCKDLFGSQYDNTYISQAIDKTNDFYGALNISIDNILFVHGTADPWHRLGKLESSNPASPAILINGTWHGADMPSRSPDDPEDLRNAKDAIINQILSWLK